MILEKEIYPIWKNILSFQKKYLIDSYKIEILNSGELNKYEGPDFKDITIKINNKILKGDLEIHRYSSDWYLHKHHLDKNYNNVILHISYYKQNNIIIRKKNKKTIPNIILNRYLNENITDIISKQLFNEEKKVKHLCYFFPEKFGYDKFYKIIENAALANFKNKTYKIETFLKKDSFKDLLYYIYMRVSGYSRNIDNFELLFKTTSLNYLYNILNKTNFNNKDITVIMLKNAGLLEKNKIKYFNSNNNLNFYLEQSKKYLKNNNHNFNWKFFQVRPNNSPIKRIEKISFLIENLLKNKSIIFKLFNTEIVLDISSFTKHLKNIYKTFNIDITKIFGFNRFNKLILNWLYPTYILYLKKINNIYISNNNLIDNLKKFVIKDNDKIDKIFWKQIFGDKKIIKPDNSLFHLGIHYIYSNECLKNIHLNL